MPFSISYTFNQENTENFILGRKPPQPNRERAETSWGQTGKGPKPRSGNQYKGKHLFGEQNISQVTKGAKTPN